MDYGGSPYGEVKSEIKEDHWVDEEEQDEQEEQDEDESNRTGIYSVLMNPFYFEINYFKI